MTRARPASARGAGPVVVLAVVLALPALALGGLWRWADDRAERAEAVGDIVELVAPPVDPAPALTTPLVSFRRTPQALARELNLDAFRQDVAPLLAAVNERSCVSVTLDGVEVGARNDAVPTIPASVQKVMVAAAALELLGEDFRYRTVVAGDVTDGVVSGDLYLVGGGDPLLSGDWYPTSNLERFPVFHHTSLDELADRVVAAGVTRVDGNVVGDGTRYDDERFAPNWGAGVAGLEAGPYSALIANDARVLGDEFRASDPDEAAARELVRLLAERGVSIGGAAASGAAPDVIAEIASIDSAPLTDVVEEMLTNSDNNTAEMLVKELGVATSGQGTRPDGLGAMRAVFESWGIDLTGVVLDDGSGLSLENRLTCSAVVDVLVRSGVDGAVAEGLPVAAESGTLRASFVDTPVAGRLLGKTGTLNNPPFDQDPPAVKALAGFLPVDGGGAIEYALVLNGPTISDQSEYGPVWVLLADVLSRYPSGAGPDVLGPR